MWPVCTKNPFQISSVFDHSAANHVAPLVCTAKLDDTCVNALSNQGAAVNRIRSVFVRSANKIVGVYSGSLVKRVSSQVSRPLGKVRYCQSGGRNGQVRVRLVGTAIWQSIILQQIFPSKESVHAFDSPL